MRPDGDADQGRGEQLLKGKTPREIYEIVRARVADGEHAIKDLNETLDWVVKEGYATEAELDAVEEEFTN